MKAYPSAPPWAVRSAVLAIAAIFLLLAGLYASRTPAWQVPDEPAHFNYAQTLADTATLPVLQTGDYDGGYLERLKAAHFPPELSIDSVRYEAWQPPAYYAYLAVFRRLAPDSALPHALVFLRFASLLLGACAITLAARATWALAPVPALAIAVPALLSVIPQHLAIAGGVTNDLATETLTTGALLLAFVEIRTGLALKTKVGPAPWRDGRAWAIGMLMGLALLTKITAYPAAGILLLGILIPAWGSVETGQWRDREKRALFVVAVALVLAGWWYIRGAVVYGLLDPLASARHDLVVTGQTLTGPVTPSVVEGFARTTFHSFWVQFGWMGVPADDRTYWFYGLLSALGVAGALLLALRLARPEGRPSRAIAICSALALLTLGVTATMMIGYNLRYLQPQGRYLYPALFPIALLLCAGYRALLPRGGFPFTVALAYPALVGAALYALFRILVPNL